jgi:hypothetical protein
MENFTDKDAILFPCTGTEPVLVKLTTSSIVETHPQTGGIVSKTYQPHPEVFLDAHWEAQAITRLPGMKQDLANPYLVFYPVPGPCARSKYTSNAVVASILESNRVGNINWKGNILVARYADMPFGEMIDCTLRELPIIYKYLCNNAPQQTQVGLLGYSSPMEKLTGPTGLLKGSGCECQNKLIVPIFT